MKKLRGKITTLTVPPEMIEVAGNRTTAAQRHFGLGGMTLNEFAVSCYLQGIEDLAQVMANRPNLLKESQPIPEFEVM